MYDRIVVPTDGSEVSNAAAEAAVAYARAFDAEIHAVHVLELGDLSPVVEGGEADELATRGREAVEHVGDLAADAGVEATETVLEDSPVHEAVLAYAADHDADCIVAGTYGRTGVDRFVLGSVAEQLLRESSVPVVTVHDDSVVRAPPERILVATDGSDTADVAVDHAIDLALAAGASLSVLSVAESGVIVEETGNEVVVETLEGAAQRAADVAVTRAEAAGVEDATATVLRGTPYRAIVDEAASSGADCVVLGTHGRTGVARYLLGSVTERVVRHSDVPVVATKAPQSD